MTDTQTPNNLEDVQHANAAPTQSGNRPDFYIQERSWVDGRPVHRQLGVAWNKPSYSAGPSVEDGKQIVVHTREQWDSLQDKLRAMRAEKEQQGQSQAPLQSQAPEL